MSSMRYFKGSGDVSLFLKIKEGQANCCLWHMMKGESIVLDSNKSGWLHTFLSCIRTFIMLKKSDCTKVLWVLSLFMYSS